MAPIAGLISLGQLPAHAPAQQARAPLEGLGQTIKATQPGSLTPEALSSFDPLVPHPISSPSSLFQRLSSFLLS